MELTLCLDLKFDIIRILKFIEKNEMKAFSHLTFHAETEEYLNDVLRDYLSYHLDVRDLKSEPYISLL